jgi:hypothetical protein
VRWVPQLLQRRARVRVLVAARGGSPAMGVATASTICHASPTMVHTLPSAQE